MTTSVEPSHATATELLERHRDTLDGAYVTPRFHVVESRRHLAEEVS